MRTKTYRGGIERTKNHGVSLSGHITMVFIIDTEADWARRIPSPGTFRICSGTAELIWSHALHYA